MVRSGTLTLLGAGASVDANYPLAADLFSAFESAIQLKHAAELESRERTKKQQEQALAEQRAHPRGQLFVFQGQPSPTIAEWFPELWKEFSETVQMIRPLAIPRFENGKPDIKSHVRTGVGGNPEFTPYAIALEDQPKSYTPYLENFFAYFDDLLRSKGVAAKLTAGQMAEYQHKFRVLRELAIKVAYASLAGPSKPTASYLAPLFSIVGPMGHTFSITTLNFDVSVERLAQESSKTLFDGFSAELREIKTPPPEFALDELENLKKMWNATTNNCHEFLGFEEIPAQSNLLIKLHGSLGWYVLEEGNGEIGFREELRHNTPFKHFRLPYEIFWRSDYQDISNELAAGGKRDLVTQTDGAAVSRKAGAVWIRPHMIYARGSKSHPDPVFLELNHTFSKLLQAAKTILAIGYSWSDVHINDLIFANVANGANLVNVSQSAFPDSIFALWTQRFVTSFKYIRKRLFMFGGGAASVLGKGSISLPNGESITLDIVNEINNGPSVSLSLDSKLPDKYR